MKKVLILFILAPALCQSQDGLLWKVTSNNNPHVSYLFGSMHTNDSLLNSFDKNWWEAFDNCKLFVGEVDASDQGQLLAQLQDGMMKDTTLADLYTEDELDRVRKFVLSKVELPVAMMLMRMKPFYIMAAIMELPDKSGPYTEIMDLRLQKIAGENGKSIVGLETPQEQASSVSKITLKDQAKMLLTFIDEGEDNSVMLKELEELYHKQHLGEMYKYSLTHEMPGAPENMMDALLEGRNKRFTDRILPLLKENSVFCAVGALHLPGESGLINQLRQSGYRVEVVPFQFGD